MEPHGHRRQHLEAADTQDGDGPVSPIADIRLIARGGHGNGVRQRAGLRRRCHLAGGQVNGLHAIGEIFHHEERPPVGRDRQAGGVGAGGQGDLARLRDPAGLHLIDPHEIVAARRSEQPAPVRRPRDADIQRLGRLVLDGLDHPPRSRVDQRERLDPLPIVADREIASVRAERRPQRAIADRHLDAGGGEGPVVGRHAVGSVRPGDAIPRRDAHRDHGAEDCQDENRERSCHRAPVEMAEGGRFELPRGFPLAVFKTAAIARSAIPPGLSIASRPRAR